MFDVESSCAFCCVFHIYGRYRKVTIVVVHAVHSPVFVQKEHRPRQQPIAARLVRLLGRDQHEQHGGLMPQDSACQQPWCIPHRHWLHRSSCQEGLTWRLVIGCWLPCRNFSESLEHGNDSAHRMTICRMCSLNDSAGASGGPAPPAPWIKSGPLSQRAGPS